MKNWTISGTTEQTPFAHEDREMWLKVPEKASKWTQRWRFFCLISKQYDAFEHLNVGMSEHHWMHQRCHVWQWHQWLSQTDYSSTSRLRRFITVFIFPQQVLLRVFFVPGRLTRPFLFLQLFGQLPAVLPSVPLPLLAQEVLQFAALLQLLVFLSQLQLLLLSCKRTTKKSLTKFSISESD